MRPPWRIAVGIIRGGTGGLKIFPNLSTQTHFIAFWSILRKHQKPLNILIPLATLAFSMVLQKATGGVRPSLAPPSFKQKHNPLGIARVDEHLKKMSGKDYAFSSHMKIFCHHVERKSRFLQGLLPPLSGEEVCFGTGDCLVLGLSLGLLITLLNLLAG